MEPKKPVKVRSPAPALACGLELLEFIAHYYRPLSLDEFYWYFKWCTAFYAVMQYWKDIKISSKNPESLLKGVFKQSFSDTIEEDVSNGNRRDEHRGRSHPWNYNHSTQTLTGISLWLGYGT